VSKYTAVFYETEEGRIVDEVGHASFCVLRDGQPVRDYSMDEVKQILVNNYRTENPHLIYMPIRD